MEPNVNEAVASNQVVAGGPPADAPATTETTPPTTPPPAEVENERKQVATGDFVECWETVVAELNSGELTGNGKEIVASRLGLKLGSVEQRKGQINKRNKAAGYGELSPMPRAAGHKFDAKAAGDLIQKAREAAAAKVAAAAAAKAQAQQPA